MMNVEFEWDEEKNLINYEKHGVDFQEARLAFSDPQRQIIFDPEHSTQEQRWFCIGAVENKILTVRFTMRDHKIRIIGAGYWRKWSKYYGQR